MKLIMKKATCKHLTWVTRGYPAALDSRYFSVSIPEKRPATVIGNQDVLTQAVELQPGFHPFVAGSSDTSSLKVVKMAERRFLKNNCQ